ncbi:glycoside hydrolase family 2 TIM barrel-domain containing protein [Aliiglaciecola sp. NS0011-25]|uniref:glycoside hydrolase family 2 TIM barrel-domain containing protein n=1 Tax=Aliiglaciecola sp. NS0011-25 TaxID=3127654 RepID=UPI0033405BE0
MQSRIAEMKLSILRFPYGHLGDNYLFNDVPFADTANGLKPRVASINETPGQYYWAVDDNGYFTQALDFDEYMAYVQALNKDKASNDPTKVEPLIMVNMLSYDAKQYPETVVTFSDLIDHATAWVKYANITRGYNIKYWQLGNEVASHTDESTYLKNFVAMAKAMKSVDPSIHIGFGEDGRRGWLKAALADASIAKYIDFISPHQYLHNKPWSESYQAWRDYNGTLTPKIDKFQRYADKSPSHKDVPIIVTEYGATGGHYPERDPKGLTFFKSLNSERKSAGYLQSSKDENNQVKLTRQYVAGKGLKKADAIDISLLKDGWITLRADNYYIKAPENPASELSLQPLASDSTISDLYKWRLLEVKKRIFYLESKAHPGLYVSYAKDIESFVLAAKNVEQAALFNLISYQAADYFPRKQARMITALSNNKVWCLAKDNSIRAKLSRSMSTSCQFVMQSPGKGYPKGTVSLKSLAVDKGYITRQDDGVIALDSGSKLSENSLWRIKYRKNSFQLCAYNDKDNFLQVARDGLLTMGGKKSQKATKFTHSDIPDANPQPKSRPLVGNFDNDLWKSLVFAEMSLGAMRLKNVSHLVHWNTHTSWHGKNGGHGNAANSLENTFENNLTPVGQVLKLINEHLLTNLVNVQEKHGFLRLYVSTSADNDVMSIIILNKNDSEQRLKLELKAFMADSVIKHWLYTGKDPEDEQPKISISTVKTNDFVTLNGNMIDAKLPATSLTVLRLTNLNSG